MLTCRNTNINTFKQTQNMFLFVSDSLTLGLLAVYKLVCFQGNAQYNRQQ